MNMVIQRKLDSLPVSFCGDCLFVVGTNIQRAAKIIGRTAKIIGRTAKIMAIQNEQLDF